MGSRPWSSDDGIRGVTSNPTIFDKAMAAGEGYDEQLLECAKDGLSIEDTYWAVVVEDIGDAADLLRPVYDAADGADGFVSVEVSPELAHDTDATIAQAKSCSDGWSPERDDQDPRDPRRPARDPGDVGAGINTNMTLIFSLARHDAVIDAYLAGIEKFVGDGGDPCTVSSVASFFVSRVDTETDRRLPERQPLPARLPSPTRSSRTGSSSSDSPATGGTRSPRRARVSSDRCGRRRRRRTRRTRRRSTSTTSSGSTR